MPRPCSTCTHPKRRWIDQAILGGTPLQAIARKYGLTRNALDWHKRHHMGKQLATTEERTGKTFAERFEQLAKDLQTLFEQATKVADKIACIREQRAMLEMAARLGMEEERRRMEQAYRDVTPAIKDIIDHELGLGESPDDHQA